MAKTEIITRITRDPGIDRGKPIIRGSRIPVDLIIDFLANGETPESIVDDYPGLTLEDIEAADTFTAQEASRTEVRRWQS